LRPRGHSGIGRCVLLFSHWQACSGRACVR
jgi:hypothetical protein